MRLRVREAIVAGELVRGDVEIVGNEVTAVGLSPAGATGTAVPGFVDIQVNGFAGVDFATSDPAGYAAAGRAMAATGVTSYQPTFICLPEDGYATALQSAAAAKAAAHGPRLIGVHLEGPFLAPDRIGAHDSTNVRSPDLATADALLEAGPVTFMTVAPEQPGCLDLIAHLVDRSVTVAVGHSDATAAVAHEAFDRGARSVTHLFNAMGPWRHRDPGIAGAALVRDDVVVTVILDGHHLDPETIEIVRRTAPGRIALITDAIAATGLPDGPARLGDRSVDVSEGLATLADGTLAGSVLTMDQAVRNFVAAGAGLIEAVDAATRVPAALVDLPGLGRLEPGSPADITVLDDSLMVMRTLINGVEHFAQ